MFDIVIESGAAVCPIHRPKPIKGQPRTMQEQTLYRDVLIEVREFLVDRVRKCRAAGNVHGQIAIGSGFGFPEFGLEETLDHNLKFMKRLCEQGGSVQAHSARSV